MARARIRRDDGDYGVTDAGGDDRLRRPAQDDGKLASTPPWHVGDGGYFDNPGSVAVIRWIEAVRELQTRDPALAGRRILFIQITPFPASPDREAPPEGQGWQASLLGPLKAMLQVRTSSQLARSDLELALLEGLQGECFEAVEFRPPYEPNRADPPLSWELSRADRQRLISDWQDETNSTTVDYIRDEYFDGDSRRCQTGSR